MDPVQKLPPEITAEIFSYLDPASLLTASLASHAWRNRVYDSRLWRELYINEGWGLDIDALRRFERQHSEPPFSQNRKSRTRHADSDVSEPQLKRRVPPAGFNARNPESEIQHANPPWSEQHGPVEADVPGSPHDAEGDREMHDVSSEGHPSPARDRRNGPNGTTSPKAAPSTSVKSSSIMLKQPNGAAKINWPHLYRQRRRLEENWLKGRFTNFQLPHPAHPEEAHKECVYAIQFSGRWLVSGSRDKTVRVWDLEARRLWYPPLLGHTKSVLCLQFDPDPSEDIIMSGSSDKNIIIWRFSTGQKLQELAPAHEDSVLNLKFDKRFLVTCSKDKQIKIWNRREMTPADKDYPRVFNGPTVKYPSYIIDTTDIPPSLLEAEIASRHVKPLPPYTLLMTLGGHGAAVNAIQINGDEIVSASGDRLIKIWDIHTGACIKTLMGHNKGIACVQFDSRRIVSGSNDDTVRIYDHVSGAEVACLQGHQNLVRTVQAGFGDPPGAEEALRLEALAVDSDYWDARRTGAVAERSLMGSAKLVAPNPNAGSKDPKDITALGARLPPGGGGSSWGRIVSGSYDETIIIWRKNGEGKWVVGHRLRQEDAALNASMSAQRGQSVREAANVTNRAMQWVQPHRQLHMIHHQHPVPHNLPNAAGSSPPNHPSAPANAGNGEQQGSSWDAGEAAGQQGNPTATHTNPHQPPAQAPANAHPPNPLAVLQQAQAQAMQAHAQVIQAHAHGHHAFARPFVNPGIQPTSRVFKIQFDARKIICASQDPRIVGWDFANGDEEIIEACQFFTGL
jgi:F-box and WD-40 domain protein 1/11